MLIWEGGSFFLAPASDFYSVVIIRLGGSAVWRGEAGFRLGGIFGPFLRLVRLPQQNWLNPETLIYSDFQAVDTKIATQNGRLFWYETMSIFMAGMVGIEPTNDGVKVRCLTAWLHPSVDFRY